MRRRLLWLAFVAALAPVRSAAAQDAEVEAPAVEPAEGNTEERAEQGAEEPTDEDASAAVDNGGEGGEELERPRVPGARRQVAVLVLATTGVDSDTADALTELAIGAVAARGGVTIVGKEEFQARLGQGEARSIECVSSTACLGRVGVELGVDELVAGTVGRRDSTWVFNINRIDIRTGNLAGRAFQEVEGDVGSLADAIQDAIPTLYEVLQRPATLLVSASVEGAEVMVDGVLLGVYRGQPVRLSEVSPGRHEVRVGAPGYYEWTRTLQIAEGATLQVDASLEGAETPTEGGLSPIAWIGAAVAGGAALTALYFGVSSQQSPDAGGSRADAIAFTDARRTDALVANVALGVAAVGLVAAAVGLFLSDFPQEEEAQDAVVGLAPRPGGAHVTLRGVF